jgi:hypothetical protein
MRFMKIRTNVIQQKDIRQFMIFLMFIQIFFISLKLFTV